MQPGAIVVLDNLSVHQSATARHAIEAAGGQLLFLPTSSPELTPIEQAFAKLKQLLRHAEARTEATIIAATHHLYPRITATDARGFFRHLGDNL